MITRFALFEGSVAPGMAAAFRRAVIEELVPTWRGFPGAVAVRVSFRESCDAGAPDYPLILAVDYPDAAALEMALASEARRISRATTGRVLAGLFDGTVHHHVTETASFPAP